MGSVEAEFQELRYTRRRYERSEKQGQRNQLVFSKVSTIDLFKNKIYHLQCLQAWSDIQTGTLPAKEILETYKAEKGSMSGLELMRKFGDEDKCSKRKLLDKLKSLHEKKGAEEWKQWAQFKDKLKVLYKTLNF